MQVISRRVNEGMIIGDDIVVTVLEVHDGHVRLGITSPSHTPSYWEETVFVANVEAELQLH